MKPEISKLRDDFKTAQSQYDQLKTKLLKVIRNCKHRWGNPQLDYILEKGYTIPADPVGTMGVDGRRLA